MKSRHPFNDAARAFLRTAAALVALSCAWTAHGQVLRYEPFTRWRLAWGGGVSSYIGDQEAERLGQAWAGPLLGGEVFHQFGPVLGLGVSAHMLRNPRLDEPDQFRSTMSALLRVTQPGTRRLSPYAQAGLHYLVGASRGGSGPTVGAGTNLRVSRAFSMYAEANVHLVYPGDVLDGSEEAHHFDALGLLSVGIRLTDIRGFFGRRPTLNITRVGHTPTPRAGIPVEFHVALNSERPQTQYVWDFGDGETGAGNPARHTFLREGVYQVVVSANNRNGTAIRYMTLDVGTPGDPVAMNAPPQPPAPPPERIVVDTRSDPGMARERPAPTLTPPSETDNPTQAADASSGVSREPFQGPDFPLPISGYTWVVGSRESLAEARAVAQPYLDQGSRPLIFATSVRGETRFRVTIGQFGTREQAQRARVRLPDATPDDSWVAFVDAQVPIMAPATRVASNDIPDFEPSQPPVQTDTRPTETGLTLVVASTSSPTSAEELASRLRASGLDAVVRAMPVQGSVRHRVTVGLYPTRTEAERERARLPADLASEAWILTLGESP